MYVCMYAYTVCFVLLGVEMMKALRNVTAHALERNRKAVPIESGGDEDGYSTMDEDEVDNEDDDIDEGEQEEDDDDDKMVVDKKDRRGSMIHSADANSVADDASLFTTTSVVVRNSKGRLSLTEKRRLKKRGLRSSEIQTIAMEKARAKAEASVAGTDGVVCVSSSSSNAHGTALSLSVLPVGWDVLIFLSL